ncbi:MAG: hypothetical protein ACXAC5_19825 [Promethearchaeota archaeon]|jgi:membrane protein YdbS with pleckstrin-like domain
MVKEKKSKISILGIYPKCPYYKPAPLLFHWIVYALGTVGIYFLNLWAAVAYLIYAILWYFFVMPIMHCRYCYYKVKETTEDSTTGKSIENLMPKDKWVESCLQKHVKCAKKYGFGFYISWFLPIILMVVSFFVSFSIFALLSLIGFIAMLAGTLVFVRYKVCPTCAIKDECHAVF